MSVSLNIVAPSSGIGIRGSHLLPRQAVFRTRDLDHARVHMCSVLAENSVTYLPRQRLLDFRHREAKLGSIRCIGARA